MFECVFMHTISEATTIHSMAKKHLKISNELQQISHKNNNV